MLKNKNYMETKKIYFAGDHNSGLHPNVLKALIDANSGKAPSYRSDKQTIEMHERFKSLLRKQDIKVLSFTSGTAANIAAIDIMTKPFHSIITPKSGHINTYETGGPTRFSGCSFDLIPTPDGKITPDQIKSVLDRKTKENIYTQPKVVYLTQPTEYGTLYSKGELCRISELCKKSNLYLFINGVRIGNALDKLGINLHEITTDIEADMVSWGGVKNGGLTDVLIILNKTFFEDSEYIYKQLGQDVAKSRYYSATVNALLENNLWLDNAKHANNMAQSLYNKIRNNPKLQLVLPVETNMIWLLMEDELYKRLNKNFDFYQETNDLDQNEFQNISFFSRLVTSWGTTEEEVNKLAKEINQP